VCVIRTHCAPVSCLSLLQRVPVARPSPRAVVVKSICSHFSNDVRATQHARTYPPPEPSPTVPCVRCMGGWITRIADNTTATARSKKQKGAGLFELSNDNGTTTTTTVPQRNSATAQQRTTVLPTDRPSTILPLSSVIVRTFFYDFYFGNKHYVKMLKLKLYTLF